MVKFELYISNELRDIPNIRGMCCVGLEHLTLPNVSLMGNFPSPNNYFPWL